MRSIRFNHSLGKQANSNEIEEKKKTPLTNILSVSCGSCCERAYQRREATKIKVQ